MKVLIKLFTDSKVVCIIKSLPSPKYSVGNEMRIEKPISERLAQSSGISSVKFMLR